MELLLITGTEKTPTVKFDALNGLIEISGKSIPEDTYEFFKPLNERVDKYIQTPQKQTIVNINLEYFNTSTSKVLFNVLKKLEKLHEANSKVIINWYYEEDDEDIQEAGEDYSSVIKIPFNMVRII